MNHYQLGYSTFKPKMRISKIKFKTLGENLAAVKANQEVLRQKLSERSRVLIYAAAENTEQAKTPPFL